MSRSDNPVPEPSQPAFVDEMSRLPPTDGVKLLGAFPDAQVADLLRTLRPALAEQLLMELGEERRQAVLAAAPFEQGRQWERNLTFPEE